MNKLEEKIRSIMDAALVTIIQEVQAASMSDITGAFANHEGRPVRIAENLAPARRATKRAVRVSRLDALPKALGFIAAAQGPVAMRDIANALGFKPEAVAPLIRKLRADGSIIMHGDKRNTRYTAKAQGAPEVPPPPPPAPDVPGTEIDKPQEVLGTAAVAAPVRRPTKKNSKHKSASV